MKKLFLLTLLSGACAFAQDISGTIEGNILDPSGAAVPNAKITVTNTDRNQVVRSIASDSKGNYVAAILPVGKYAVKVEANGFKTESVADIVLNVNDDIKLNVSLSVGAASDQVTVTENVAAIELSTPANSTTITGTQVREISLSTRNYEQLVGLMPGVTASQTDELYYGVSAPSGTAATLPFSINGQRNSANNWTLDGADNVDRGSNLTLLNFPSADAIEEFKVQRSLYTAESGRAGGGQVNVITKSGGAGYHGDVYEFFRNNYFTADNFINKATNVLVVNGEAQTPPLRWNDFGGTFGGPVPGTGNSHKTFFFYSQEDSRIITYTTFSPTLPTTAMMNGQFSSPVCISFTATGTCATTGNSITNINPIAAGYIKDIYSKLPLGSSTTPFFAERNIYNHDQELARIDHQFNEKFSIWGRFLNDSIPTTEPGGLFTGSTVPGAAVTNTNAPGRSYVIHEVNSIGAHLLNEGGFNFSRGAILSTPAGALQTALNPDIKPTLPYASTLGTVPALSFTSGTSLIGYGPYNEYNRNYTYFDNVTWIKGRHTFKTGVSINRYQKTENAAGNNVGTFTFTNTGVPTGTGSFLQSWANFLLGNVSTFTQASMDVTPNLKAWQSEAYFQDDFRVSKNLTVYAGVRWSFFGQPSDDNGLLSTFDPSSYRLANAPAINPANGNIVAGTGTNPSTNGIIYGGKGSPYGDHVAQSNWKDFAPRFGVAWDPFGDGKTSVRTGYGIFFDAPLFGTYEQNIFANPPYVYSISIPNTTFANPGGGTASVSAAPLVLRATPPAMLTPYVQQWSLDIQRTLPKGIILDAGYFGSKGTHLIGIVDINEAAPGVAYAAGLKTGSGNIFTSTDTPRINAVRPYLGFNAINSIEPAFDSNYHSLQVNIRKDFKTNGIFSAAYTWSKNLTDNASDRSNAPQNAYNWHEGEYGPATLDRKQVLTVNYVYPLPFFKSATNALLKYGVAGWQLSGISTFSTGLPFTVTTSSVDPAGLGILGSSAASARPDMTCDPNANAPHNGGLNGLWFNTSCFTPVAQGQIRPGNAGRGVVRGPGYENWNMSLFKNIPMGERFKLQMRLETFNTFNHGNPSGIGSLNNTSAVFGLITSYREARQVQLGAKLNF